MSEVLKSKRGGQPGNQNARKHGFYSPVMDSAQRHRLKEAALVKGLDEEINLLRVKLQSVVEHDPDNVRLILQAAVSLGRLMRTRNKLGEGKEDHLAQAIKNIITDIGVPLGVMRLKDAPLKSAQPPTCDL
jgi:hypothetical protein